MNILYVTSNPLQYSASANKRNIALIKGLLSQGHKVSVFSTEPQVNSVIFDDSELSSLNIDEFIYIKLGHLHSKLTSTKSSAFKSKLRVSLFRLYNKLHLYDSRASEVKKISNIDFSKKHFDLMISSSDPKSSHLFAEKLLQLYPNIANRWIQYWGDPFYGDINSSTIVPKFLIKREEKRLLTLCDKAVFVSPLTVDCLKKRYKKLADKINFIPVGYAKEMIYPPLSNSSKIRISYCGNYFSKDRNLTPLYNSAIHLADQCELVLVGDSDCNFTSKQNIRLFGRSSSKFVSEIESQSDIIVCVCNRCGTQIPGKIYHAAGSNKVVLIILDGDFSTEIYQFFKNYDRFIFCQNTEEGITNLIRNLNINECNSDPCPDLHINNLIGNFLA